MSQDNELDALVKSQDPLHPANLIPDLCKGFYTLGWVTGTGGGISIRSGDNIYIAPSGVQKERIQPEDIFVLPFNQPVPTPHADRIFLRRPTKPLKESACTPLFWNAFTLRNAGACIHTHSQNAVLATLIWPNEFKIERQMIKGVRVGGVGKALTYLDTLVVPVIDNTPNEEDLTDSMAERHGVYVWGPDWEKAKGQAECLDYLFEIAVKMHAYKLPVYEGEVIQG
ncbi:Methylthioribulose-1-phosphate dehydratase [Auriculariales sp. MPI-PUGE-AT-0066]|nr:Methylthioribulose-1-phosphate dehydratase [Auriculariales sp. MPI-PUGE-AT-0066]